MKLARNLTKTRRRRVLWLVAAISGLAILAAAGGAGYQWNHNGWDWNWSWGGGSGHGCDSGCYTPPTYTPPTYTVPSLTNTQTNKSTVNVTSDVNNVLDFSGATLLGGTDYLSGSGSGCGCDSWHPNTYSYTPPVLNLNGLKQWGQSNVTVNVNQHNTN